MSKKIGFVAALIVTGAGATPAFADPCTASLPPPGASFMGQVRYVGDGDSLCVGPSSNPATWIEVRIADFYSPELHAPGGSYARTTLQRLTTGQTAHCLAGKRSYDRVVARCTINGISIGDMMRQEGISEGGRGR